MDKLDPEIKAKWLDALESGEYKQGKYRLKHIRNGEATYCCLGVLTEACGLGTFNGDPATPGYQDAKFVDSGVDGSKIPFDVAQRISLDFNAMNTLVRYNDAEGRTFEQIAAYVRENL